MKIKKNKKGFTLVEVIAAVIIIGIMFTAAIIGYSKYIEQSKDNYYKKQKDLVTQAGRDFFNDNRGRLPVNISEESCVLLSTLVNNKYIDKVVGYDKKACKQDTSKVCAQKISLTKYKYTTTLDCGEKEEEVVGTAPNINFSLLNVTSNKIEDSDFIQTDKRDGVADNIYSIKVKITSDTNIGSYDYYVHEIKNNKDKVVRSKKGISVPEGTKTYEIEIPLNSAGTFYIELKAFNEKSNKNSISGQINLTSGAVTCDNAVVFDLNGSDWTSEDITNNIVVSNEFKFNYYYIELVDAKNNKTIEKIKYDDKEKITTKNLEHIIKAKDNASSQSYYKIVTYDNNLNDTCNIKSKTYKTEKIKPRCTVTSPSNSWTNENVTVHVACNDEESGCVKDSEDIIVTDEYNDYYTVEVSDKAGNKNTCTTSEKLLIDKHVPGASIASTNNVAASQTATLTMSDDNVLDKYYFGTIDPDGSNASSITYTDIPGDVKTFTTTSTVSSSGKYYLVVFDKAGNKKVVNDRFYQTSLVVNAGSVTPTKVITLKGNSFNLPTPSSGSGYIFENWYKENTYTTVVDTNYKPTDNLTLYGKFKENNYTIAYTMNGGNDPETKPVKGAYGSDVVISNPTKTFTVNIDKNGTGATVKNASGTAVTSASETLTFDGWTSSTLGSSAQSGTASNSQAAWNGSKTKNTYFKNLTETGTVTMVANWASTNITLPNVTKTGYTCKYNTSKDGTGTEYTSGGSYQVAANDSSSSKKLFVICTINNPETPTITGGATKIYGSSATTLTCATTATYASGTSKYYSFGYATSDGETPGNWTTATTTATLQVAADAYVGQRWYSCRVYASDGTLMSSNSTSLTSADTEMTINNAKLTFDENSCGTLEGTNPLYVKKGTTGVLTTVRGTTAGTIPTLTVKDGYSLDGWYDGDTQVINKNGTTVASVENWTDENGKWLITANKTLKAKCTANTYTIAYTMNGGNDPKTKPTSGTYDQNVQISNPATKTFDVNIDQYFYLFSNEGEYIKKVTKTTDDTLSTGVTSNQTFKGWTSTTVGSNAQSGSSSSSLATWSGSNTKNTYFKNLRESGTVTMIANWNSSSVTLPALSKYGYTCKYNTKSDGTGTSYDPETTYSPSTTSGSTTLYPVCKANKFTVVYVANRENYLLNYTFSNKAIVTSGDYDTNCTGTTCRCAEGESNLKDPVNYLKYNKYGGDGTYAYHINEWPVYNQCIVSGYDSSHSSYKFFPHLDVDPSDSSNNVVAFQAGNSSYAANPLDFSFQLSDFFSKDRIYVLSFDVKKASGSGNIVLKTGIRSGVDRTQYYSIPIDGTSTEGTSFSVDASTSWKTKTYIFKISSDYEYYDRFSNGYLDTGNNETDHVDSGRPELFFSYDADDPSIKGTVYIDNVNLFGADSTILDYDSELDVESNFSKNGYLFGGWYKNMNSALALNREYQISGDRLNLNKDNLTCETYKDDTSHEYNACYLYAGWYEKEYKVSLTNLPSSAQTVSRKVVKFSSVPIIQDSSNNTLFTKNSLKFNGWGGSWKDSVTYNNDPFLFKLDNYDSKGKEKCDGISSNSQNVHNISNTSSFNSKYDSCGYTDNQTLRLKVNNPVSGPVYNKVGIYLSNDAYPNISKPGFGGYCQDATLEAGQEYVHVVILGMGNGLYMHYDKTGKSSYEWLTSNEGAAAAKMYVYKFTPSSNQTNTCIYFSQLYEENPYLYERQHMSANLYFSGIYKTSDASSFLGQLCSDNDCSDGKDCCYKTWNATWEYRPVRTYYNVNGGALPSSLTNYSVDDNDWIIRSGDGSLYYKEYPYDNNVTFQPTSKFGLTKAGYNQSANAEWKVGSTNYKQATSYAWTTLYSAADDHDTYNRVDVYANWAKTTSTDTVRKITYNANGGSGAPAAQSYVYSTSGSITLSKVIPTRTGYVFKGWARSASATTAEYQPGQNWSRANNNNYTLYAVWSDIYSITYNANGGSGAPAVQTYHYSKTGTINLSTTKPTRSGYTFLGWATSASATKAGYQPGQAWSRSNTGNYTLYAVWKKINYCWKSNWKCSYYYCSVGDRYETYLGGDGGGCANGYTFHKYSSNTNSGYCSCDSLTCAAYYDAGSYVQC